MPHAKSYRYFDVCYLTLFLFEIEIVGLLQLTGTVVILFLVAFLPYSIQATCAVYLNKLVQGIWGEKQSAARLIDI